MTKSSIHKSNIHGFSMVEVLVTIVILMIGLLGLAGLQSRALTSQMESYQRAQALVLLKDMADRIEANRQNAASYITAVPAETRGTGFNGSAVVNCTGLAGAALDLCEWHNALLGASEKRAGATNIGAMIGARGCVFQLVAPASGVAQEVVVVVAWQGMNSTAAPHASVRACGEGAYKDKNGASDETLHRVVSLPINFADMH